MARIRTLKPEFWSDEKLGPLDPLTRLVFLGLISQADDAGRLVDSVRQLDGLLFPYTEDTCAESLEILARLSRISRYSSESGQRLIQIDGWETHQRVDKPAKYVLPPPPPEPVGSQGHTKHSGDPREILARSSRPDLRPTTYDHGPTTSHHTRAIRGLFGWQGSEGTDPILLKAFDDPTDRDRCLEIAVARMEAEGLEYQGRLFRKILETVVREQKGESSSNGRRKGPLFPEDREVAV